MNERQIFEAALDIADSARREAYLSQVCGADAALRGRVDVLLAAHAAASQFLETPAIEQLNTPPDTSGDATLQLPPSHVAPPGEVAAEMDSDGEIPQGPDLSFLSPSTKTGSIGTLGHYEILKVLGQGAFGIVFKAFDEKLHRHVAIKTMSVPMAATSPARKRFLREARAAAAIRHENVVQVYSVEEQPIPYLVMEYIDGETLQQKQRNQGPLEVPETLHLVRQIASGLAAAHSQSLIHRDVKPGNILLEKGAEQKVKITDFGLARAADDASLTRSGMISGTPLYMSPEQAFGQSLDHRSDLFSLGSVMYELITGRPPFRAPNTVAVLKRVVDDTPRPIQELIPETPDWLIAIVNQLLAKKPDDRYQSAKEVADLLARCQSELQLTGQVTCVPPQPASPARAAGSASARSTPDDSDPTAVHPPLMSLAGKEVRSFKSLFWIVFVMMFTGGMTTAVINAKTTQINKLLAALLVIGAVVLLGRVLSIRKRSQSPKASLSQTPSNAPQRDLFWWWAGIAGIAGVTSIALPMIFFDTWPVGFQALPGLIVVMVIAISLLLNNVRRARAFGQRVAAQDPPVTDFSGVWAAHVAEYNKRTPQEHEQDRRRRHWTALMLGGLLMLVSASPFLAAKFGRYFNSWIWPAIPTLPQTALTAGLNFDGKDDHVEFAPVDWSYPQFTIEAFVTSTLRSDNGITVSLTSGGKPWEIMELYDGPHNGSGQRQSGAQIMGKTPIATAYGPLTPGVRQHRALVFDGSHMHYYINGLWQGKRRAEAYEGENWKRWNLKQLRLGCDRDGKKRFEGQIDQVRISKVARYNDNFAPVTSVESDDQTLALYDFAQGSGDVLKDISGNGHDGKIVGATWVKPNQGRPQRHETTSDTNQEFALQLSETSVVDLPTLPLGPEPITLDVVVSHLAEQSGKFSQIATIDQGEGGERIRHHIFLERSEYTCRFHLFSQPGQRSKLWFGTAPRGNRQHRVTAILDVDSPQLFIDGVTVPLQSADWAVPPRTETGYARLGSGVAGSHFSGQLHELTLSRGVHPPNDRVIPSALPLSDGVLVAYDMHEGQGDVLHDRSGNHRDARLRQIAWVKATSPEYAPTSGLSFDGVDDVVRVPSLRFAGAPWTMEAWITPDDSQTTANVMGWDAQSVLWLKDGQAWGQAFWSDTEVPSPHSGNVLHGVTQHLAFVIDTTELRVYVNGEDCARFPLPPGGTSSSVQGALDHFAIGAFQDRFAPGKARDFFRGTIHAARISKTARYSGDFLPTRLDRDDSTVAVYDFAQGSGDVLKDISGNGHNGKIVGATWVNAEKTGNQSESSAALDFNGVDAYVSIPPLPLDAGQITIDAILDSRHLSKAGISRIFALDQGDGDKRVKRHILYHPSPDGSATLSLDAVNGTTTTVMQLPWVPLGRMRLTTLWDGSVLECYINGARQKLYPYRIDTSERTSEEYVCLGAGRVEKREGLGYFWPGTIDEFKVSVGLHPPEQTGIPTSLENDGNTIALYDFAQGSGDVLKDISGNGHDGKIVGATWVKPMPADSAEVPLKPGLKFATPESHVAVDTVTFQPEEPLTLEAWVTAEEFQPTGYLSLVAGLGPLDLKLTPSAKAWEFVMWNQSVKKPLSDSMLMALCQPGSLTHLCGIWNPESGMSFYVDGKKVGTSKTALTGDSLLQFAQSSADSALNPSLVIGGLRPVSESTKGNQLAGIIHEMRVSRVVRYQDDFVPTQKWQSDPNTIALYDFAQGSGDVLKDISGNGHDGKIVGAQWVKSAMKSSLPLTTQRLPEVSPEKIARWVIQRGGAVELHNDGKQIRDVSELPPAPLTISRLFVHGPDPFTVEDAQQIAGLPDLVGMELHHLTIQAGAIRQLSSSVTLRHFGVFFSDSPHEVYNELLTFSRLEDCTLHYANIDDSTFSHLGLLRRLQVLNVAKCSKISDQSFVSLAKSPPPALQTVLLFGVPLGEIGLEALSRLPHLTELVLGEIQPGTRLAPLKQCSALSFLELREGVRGISLEETQELHDALNDCSIFTASSQIALPMNVTGYRSAVEELGSDRINIRAHVGSGTGLIWLQHDQFPPKSRTLNVETICTQKFYEREEAILTDRQIELISQIRDVRDLKVEGLPPDGLQRLLSLRNLTNLCVNAPVANQVFEQLSQFPKLHTVGLLIPNDEVLKRVLELPHLMTLKLDRRMMVTDASLELLANTPQLRQVDFHWVNIPDEKIQAFARRATHIDVIFHEKLVPSLVRGLPGDSMAEPD